jgi:uncharacterized coiled-coil protein SlyX
LRSNAALLIEREKAELEKAIAEKNSQLAEKDALIAQLRAELGGRA